MIPVSAIADPWKDSRDLESLHAAASDAVLRAVARLRASTQDPATERAMPLAILGTAGIGKTHLFSRLRRRLHRRAVLVHIRPLVSGPITPRHLLRQVMEQLSFVNGDWPQMDTLVNGLITHHLEGDPACPSQGYELLRTLDEDGRTRYLEDLLEMLVFRHPDADDGVLSHLLHLPFLAPLKRRAAQGWLSGMDLNDAQYARIGEHGPLPETRLIPALRTLAQVAAPVSPLVLVFDQLENLATAGSEAILAFGNLVSELTDTVQDLVVVQMCLDTEWERGIRPQLSLSHRDRLEGGGTFMLEMPNAEQRRSLVALWTDDTPHEAPWEALRPALEGSGITPRMLAASLKAAVEGSLDPLLHQEVLGDRLQEAWDTRQTQVRSDIDRLDREGQGPAPGFFRDALLQFIQVLGLGGHISDRDLIALANRRVLLVSGTHHRAVGAELRRAESLPGALLLIREQWRPFPPSWKSTNEQATRLATREDLRWLWLGREDAVRLLTFDTFCKDVRSGDLAHQDGRPVTLPEAVAWFDQHQQPRAWALSEALLGGAGDALPLQDAPRTAAGPDKALEVLHRLHVASLDRLLREGAAPSRTQLIQSLKAHASAVEWLGSSLVCLASPQETAP